MKLLFLTQVVDDADAVLGFLPTWLRELASRVERLVVVTFQQGELPNFPPNVEVRSLGRERGAGSARLLFAFRREVRRAVREAGCDVVLAHMVPKYAVLARRLAVPNRVPIHLWYTHAGVNRWLRWSEPIVEKIFTASEESLRIPTRKKVVTGHGIDVSFLRPSAAEPCDRALLLTVGRVTPSKDVETLIRGLERLRSRGHDARLKIVGGSLAEGDDDYGASARALAASLGLAEKISFDGPIPYRAIPAVYRRAALFVSASRTGSVDKAVLEAMACATPVLTSNDAFTAIVPERFRFAPRDVEELAAKADAILRWDPARRASEGQELRAIVERDHAVGPLMDRLVREMESKAVRVVAP